MAPASWGWHADRLSSLPLTLPPLPARLPSAEFPERPGALRKFLTGLRTGWNVSLFHYRNYGADTGKVLAGLQVPPEDNAAFQHWIDFELGYAYVEATNDPVYKDFFCS